MGIQQEIRSEMKDALRARDQLRLDVLRQVETEVSNAKTAPGFSGSVDDDLYRKVIGAYVKRMSKALDEYANLGERASEMVKKLSFEVSYLERWLPRKLDERRTRELVREAIAELGVSGPQAVGRVTGHVIKQHKDEVEEVWSVESRVRSLLEVTVQGVSRGEQSPLWGLAPRPVCR